MLVQSLADKRIAIWGFAREGASAYSYLRKRLPNLPLTILSESVIEDEYRSILPIDRFTRVYENGGIGLERLRQFDVVIKSPGISLYRQEIHQAKQAAVTFTSTLNIWFAENSHRRVIAVTGTKGKSTTTMLIARGLEQCGHTVRVAGNIGLPVLSSDDKVRDIDVIEVSSYQASDLTARPEVGVLVNLFPEHLNWHGSVENYFRDKVRLLQLAKKRIINAKDKNSQLQCCGLSDLLAYNTPDGFHAQGRDVFYGTKHIGKISNDYMARRHNVSNICAALSAIALIGADPCEAFAGIETFQGLPHRQQVVDEIHDVLYVDDSISTIPQSTLAAIATWNDRDITLLLGGQDRGIDYSQLINAIYATRIRRVILLPGSGDRIGAAIRTHEDYNDSQIKLWSVDSLEQAIAIAQQETPRRGVVLLSPASPSYGYFRNYEERGRRFRELVRVRSNLDKTSLQ